MKNNRLIIGSLITLLVIAAGFCAGYFYKNARQDAPEVSKKITAQTKPNPNIYDVSPPSRGAAILEKTSINIKPFNNMAVTPLTAEEAKNIQVGQAILLYDANGMLLEILGEVTAVTPVSKSVNIGMVFQSDAEHPSSVVASGEIITSRKTDAQRIPLTAIVKDSDGNEHLWEVIKNQDGTNIASYKEANIISRNYDFAVIEQHDSTSNVFVLNPDDELMDSQIINTRQILYSGPPQTDDAMIAYLVDQRTPRDITDPYRGPKIIAPCESANLQQSNLVDAVPAATKCGSNPDALQDFITKIRQAPPSTP